MMLLRNLRAGMFGIGLSSLATFIDGNASAAENHEQVSAGLHRPQATIETPAVQGWRLSGDGASGVIDESPWTERISGPTSRLLWSGPKNSIMLRARGANWTLCDLSLLGHESRGVNALRIAHKGDFGGSWGTVRNVSFANFAEAIRIGDTVDDHGNDNHHFEQIGFSRCDGAFVLGARQAVHLTAERWNCRWCKSLVKVEAGGKFALQGLDTDCAGTLLHTTGDANQLAPNNAIYSFRGITVDAGAGGKVLTLVNQEQPHWMRATFEDIWFPNGPYEVEATLRGRDSLLRLYRIENFPAATRLRLLGGATCVIYDSVLPGPVDSLLTAGSDGEVVAVNCWIGGRLIPRVSASGH